MAEVLQVINRATRGKHQARKQRASGSIPAILYGHGKESVSLTIEGAAISAVLRHGGRVVDLEGDITHRALVREVQWDAFGTDVLHVDLTRVALDEKLTVFVSIELRGDAPGIREGGIVDQLVHEVELECSADEIPDKLKLNVNKLALGDSIAADALVLPASGQLKTPAETVIVHCVAPQAEEEDEGEPSSAEPEVIGRKGDEGVEADES